MRPELPGDWRWADELGQPSTDNDFVAKLRASIVRGDEFTAAVEDLYDEAEELLLRKHQDYGPLNIARSPGGPLNGLRVRLWDKLARINHLLDNDQAPKNEALRDSFMDMANYALIAVLVLDGTWPGLEKEEQQ